MSTTRPDPLDYQEGNMDAPQNTDILADRLRFDIIAQTESGHELRVWTDGERVVWQDCEGRSGYMPRSLFLLAAHQTAHYCEDAVCADDSGFHDDFLTMWNDSLSCPVDLAMAHPYWAQPDHELNDLRFGFASFVSNYGLDVQPDSLKPRRGSGVEKVPTLAKCDVCKGTGIIDAGPETGGCTECGATGTIQTGGCP